MLAKAWHLLSPGDINVTSASVTGADLWLSPRALSVFPVTIEAKCQERINVWAALSQCERHVRAVGAKHPLLVFRKNREKLRAVIDFDELATLFVMAHCYMNDRPMPFPSKPQEHRDGEEEEHDS